MKIPLMVTVQEGLCTAHLAKDDGKWMFTVCRRGLEIALGRKVKDGEKMMIFIEASDS